MSKSDASIIVEGQLAENIVPQTGTIIESGGKNSATVLIQTESGPQLALATVSIGNKEDIISSGGKEDALALVQTADGPQLALKVVSAADGGGEDVNTIMLWHLDTDYKDAINGTALGGSLINTTDPKFGAGCGEEVGEYDAGYTSWDSPAAPDIDATSDSWTVDAWIYNANQGAARFGMGPGLIDGYYPYGSMIRFTGDMGQPRVQAFINHKSSDRNASAEQAITTSGWHHIAMQQDAAKQKVQFFLDGTMFYEYNGLCGKHVLSSTSLHAAVKPIKVKFDEIRVSNVARYPSTGFTPETNPY